ncbi:hypothetical protein D1AOALGA4SA_6518 [Olavius algarvensis Delta 1 endosymbiont]|nr:hypothetical protein D1AOALGA4SA_6518 [Olavius algarvensis Delta 1 endosymbiont]
MWMKVISGEKNNSLIQKAQVEGMLSIFGTITQKKATV